jgi:hypothetical protein
LPGDRVQRTRNTHTHCNFSAQQNVIIWQYRNEVGNVRGGKKKERKMDNCQHNLSWLILDHRNRPQSYVHADTN